MRKVCCTGWLVCVGLFKAELRKVRTDIFKREGNDVISNNIKESPS